MNGYLDARKLFTLQERNYLENWLLKRDITSIIFVVNFLNLIDADQRKKVWSRAISAVENFQTDTPAEFKLYHVDALPALRSQLKDDPEGIRSSGLTTFITELEQIIAKLSQEKERYRLPRIKRIASEFSHALQTKRDLLRTHLLNLEKQRKENYSLLSQKIEAIKKTFERNLYVVRDKLSYDTLITNYKLDLISALKDDNFYHWKNNYFQPNIESLAELLNSQVNNAFKLSGNHCFNQLSFDFSGKPVPNLPSYPNRPNGSGIAKGAATGAVIGGVIPVFGTLLGAVVGGVAGGLVGNTIEEEEYKKDVARYYQRKNSAYEYSANKYLSSFSNSALSSVDAYAKKHRSLFKAIMPKATLRETELKQQIECLTESVHMLS